MVAVMVVGALIYILGIDLVKEALWDNRHRASLSEYITIISIMVMMTVWDFVTGVLFGIVVCCTFSLKSLEGLFLCSFRYIFRNPKLPNALHSSHVYG